MIINTVMMKEIFHRIFSKMPHTRMHAHTSTHRPARIHTDDFHLIFFIILIMISTFLFSIFK